MRKLKTSDFFEGLRTVHELGVRQEMIEIAKKIESSGDTIIPKDVGFEFAFAVMEKAGTQKCEKQIYRLISGPLEIPEEAIGDMELEDIFEILKEYIEMEGQEGLKRFFLGLARQIRSE